MSPISRREFVRMAAALGATAVVGDVFGAVSNVGWQETRKFFPEGVASGDPDSSSVLLWTRYPQDEKKSDAMLVVEVSEDEAFRRVVATAKTPVVADADWTCRVLVGGLRPARVYWYRFTDQAGNGSRIGRTMTSPDLNESRPVSFAFVSCQNANQGAQNAYRRRWE